MENEIVERLMRMGIEYRMITKDINELRNLAHKQLQKEKYTQLKSKYSSLKEWFDDKTSQRYFMTRIDGVYKILAVQTDLKFNSLKLDRWSSPSIPVLIFLD